MTSLDLHAFQLNFFAALCELTIALPMPRAMGASRAGATAAEAASGQDELLAYYQRRAGEKSRSAGRQHSPARGQQRRRRRRWPSTSAGTPPSRSVTLLRCCSCR